MNLQKKEVKEAKEILPPVKKTGAYEIPMYKDVKMVKGIFKNIEAPGTGIEFPYRGNWKGPVRNWSFFDGCEYKIPEELARHLNGNNDWDSCTYRKLKYVGTDGSETTAKPIISPSMPGYRKGIGEKKARFLFQITG